jgi:hypothetical protein
MTRTRPAGFPFLSACALACACVMASLLAKLGGDALSGRFAVAATGALALVTAEALAFVRPWAFGASLAFAGAFFAAIFVTADSVDSFFVVATVTLIPVIIALAFVYNGLRSVHAIAHSAPPARIRVP